MWQSPPSLRPSHTPPDIPPSHQQSRAEKKTWTPRGYTHTHVSKPRHYSRTGSHSRRVTVTEISLSVPGHPSSITDWQWPIECRFNTCVKMRFACACLLCRIYSPRAPTYSSRHHRKGRYGEIGFGLRELNQRIGSLLIVILDILKGQKSRDSPC